MATTVAVSGTTTRVKKVVVGTPVRRVSSEGGTTLQSIGNVDSTVLENGSTLVYNASSEKWVATVDLENQNMDGGSF